MGVDLDPGLFGEGEEVAGFVEEGGAGEVLAAVAAFVPGDDDDGRPGGRACEDARGHATQHDGLCFDGEGAGAIERGPEEFVSDAAGSVGKIGRRLPRRGDDAPTEATILTRLHERLAGYKCPKRVVFCTELPRNAMGKVQKAELRKRYADTFAS